MQAHRQWMSRAPDERFTSLIDMQAFKREMRDNSRSHTISSRGVNVLPVEDDPRALQILGGSFPAAADSLVIRAAVLARQPRQLAGKLFPRDPDAWSDDRGLPQLQSALHPRR
jgi:hypothetical protein